MEDAKSDEVTALWIAVFGEPPSVREDFDLMLRLIFEATPLANYGGPRGPFCTIPLKDPGA